MPSDTPAAVENESVTPTPIRTIRIDDELWDLAQKKAKRRRETVAIVVRRALLAYVGDELDGVHIHAPYCPEGCTE